MNAKQPEGQQSPDGQQPSAAQTGGQQAPGMLLSLDDVTTYYAQIRILEGISLHVGQGELVCLLGGNASGKSTTLKTILGIVRPRAGRVLIDGTDVTSWPVPQRIARGIAIVPENRRLFGQMTVRENLELGAVLRGGEKLDDDFERVHTLFPRLYERRNQLAGTLSGGEQQMVAMGRALMSRPKLLLMDEPSMGLSPALVQQNFQIIRDIHASGVAVLIVEQNAAMALSIADRGYVLSTGVIVLEGLAADLLRSDDLKRAYLGR
jgi:branched-chain amino acid transport system ATP-binding protein